ncbi:MAG: L-threonylcarbamoyladenylate synthase [Saprospiraceae bacterium]
MATIGTDINEAVRLLNQGNVVAIPTETVYGLAANALNEEAVKLIFSTKERPMTNPLIIHLPSLEAAKMYVQELPILAKKLAEVFCPGSLTMVLPKKEIVPDTVTAGLPNVAIRIPNHDLTLELLRRIDFPLAAPSANPFGYISPTTAQHVANQLGEKIPYILDGGLCQKGLESTIVSFQEEKVVVYRLGAISLEDLAEVVGEENLILDNLKLEKPLSPGMLPYHYSPHTSLYLTDNLENDILNYNTDKIGIITLSKVLENVPREHQIQLSETDNLRIAGHLLYNAMHELDALDLDAIFVEKMPDKGIGKTMNDRLKRAAYKRQ